METQTSQSIETHASLDARLQAARLVKETVSASSGPPTKDAVQLQAKTETNSTFGVALDSPTAPKSFVVEIDFRVKVMLIEGDKELATYESKFAASFLLASSSGITDWSHVPAPVFAPYFAIVQHLAINRAEGTFAAMGMRGIVLPRNSTFESTAV